MTLHWTIFGNIVVFRLDARTQGDIRHWAVTLTVKPQVAQR